MIPGLNKYVILAAAVIAFGGGFWLAKTIGDAKFDRFMSQLDKANLDFADAVIKKDRLNRERVDLIAENIILQQERDVARKQVIVKEVVRYESIPGAGDCELLPEWVWLHDASAASGPVPGNPVDPPYAETGGAGSGITDVDAIQVITGNYSLCNDLRTELAGWRAYGEMLQGVNEQTRRSSRR